MVMVEGESVTIAQAARALGISYELARSRARSSATPLDAPVRVAKKMDMETAQKIRSATGLTQAQIAKDFGFSLTLVRDIIKGRAWPNARKAQKEEPK